MVNNLITQRAALLRTAWGATAALRNPAVPDGQLGRGERITAT
jgi:hypothetical protein